MQILNPPNWKRPKGYSNGIVAPKGRTVYLAGIVGWNEQEQFETQDFAAQCRQIFINIVAVLAEAGGRPEHIVRMNWFITDTQAYQASAKEVGAAYREIIGPHYPTMAVIVVKDLIEVGAKLEIEATAVIPD
jgi:enamine deaminase RidA (YjgF/YER057c/UK114 family)